MKTLNFILNDGCLIIFFGYYNLDKHNVNPKYNQSHGVTWLGQFSCLLIDSMSKGVEKVWNCGLDWVSWQTLGGT